MRFRTGDGDFAVPVDYVREVRSVSGMRPIPSAGPGVVGMLALGGEVLTVVSVLGSGSRQVLVIDGGGMAFGLLVEEVIGVVTIDDQRLGPPPVGHGADIFSGVIAMPNDVVLLVDATAMARSLRRDGER